MSTALSIITRAILIFFWEGEDCYEQWRNGIQAEIKKGHRSLSCLRQRFIIFFITRKLRLLFAHNHAALKLHKVHDRVCTEKSPFVCFLFTSGYFLYSPPPPPFALKIIKFIIYPPVHLTNTLLFILPCLL